MQLRRMHDRAKQIFQMSKKKNNFCNKYETNPFWFSKLFYKNSDLFIYFKNKFQAIIMIYLTGI